jgi:hypothetical protein
MRAIHRLPRLFTIGVAVFLFARLGLTAQTSTEPQAEEASQSTSADPDKAPEMGAGKVTPHGESFGTADQAATWIPMASFQPRDSAGHAMAYDAIGFQHRTGGTGLLWAPLELPNGALVTTVRIIAIDNSASNAGVLLTRFGSFVDDFEDLGSASTTGSGSTSEAFFPDYTIDTDRNIYVIYVSMPIDANVQVKGVRVLWQRQVTAAPGAATFGDVPTNHLFFRTIEALAASGITSGCGSGNFCPEQPVTRGEIAKFLANALGLHHPF